MSIYFCNSEPIDLNAIAVMGVSVKVTDNPIGYFGTGLKYAIATLLRTGHRVGLIRDGKVITFTAEPQHIRGQEFHVVFMDDQRLGFTTDLGRNWETWQAYRELHCNCTDENGVIADTRPDGSWGTIFFITGQAIEKCHRNRHQIFLESEPLFATPTCAIHHGGGAAGFYRGVKAHELNYPGIFTYNVLCDMELTEDRTVKYWHRFECRVEEAIVQCHDEDIIEAALMAERGTYENSLGYSSVHSKPSLPFMDVAFRLRDNLDCNHGAHKLWLKHSDVRLTYEEVTLDRFEEELVSKALVLVHRLGAGVDRRDFIVVNGLGKGRYGAVRNGQILIARRTFDMGHMFIASTLYEEWLHANQKLRDESRDMQNLLFEKLFGMVERVVSMEEAGG